MDIGEPVEVVEIEKEEPLIPFEGDEVPEERPTERELEPQEEVPA